MKNLKLTTGIPPLIIIGTIIVLFPIFAFMTIDRINKQKAHSVNLLLEKSTALIRAFEAGTYTGMMNMAWTQNAMENLLRETAALPDITYLFIVNKDGVVLVHNQKEKMGLVYGQNLDFQSVLDNQQTGWRIIKDENNNKVFQVYKPFTPTTRKKKNGSQGMGAMHQRMRNTSFQNNDIYKNTIIFVGLDMALIAQAETSRMSRSMSGLAKPFTFPAA
jgi:two-component system sensor histidine kinase HydH